MNKIKFDTAPELGVKSVHGFWVYELLLHPEGLSAAEIAAVSMVDRSLVSREIETLKAGGYVRTEDNGKKRSYNSRITLTDSGLELALFQFGIQHRRRESLVRDQYAFGDVVVTYESCICGGIHVTSGKDLGTYDLLSFQVVCVYDRDVLDPFGT